MPSFRASHNQLNVTSSDDLRKATELRRGGGAAFELYTEVREKSRRDRVAKSIRVNCSEETLKVSKHKLSSVLPGPAILTHLCN